MTPALRVKELVQLSNHSISMIQTPKRHQNLLISTTHTVQYLSRKGHPLLRYDAIFRKIKNIYAEKCRKRPKCCKYCVKLYCRLLHTDPAYRRTKLRHSSTRKSAVYSSSSRKNNMMHVSANVHIFLKKYFNCSCKCCDKTRNRWVAFPKEVLYLRFSLTWQSRAGI